MADLLDMAIEQLARAANVLHVPCGDGLDSVRLVRRGWSVTCVDADERNLILASQSLAEAQVHARLIKAHTHTLPMRQSSYDICFSLAGGDVQDVTELCRVTKPGGLLVLGVSTCAAISLLNSCPLRDVSPDPEGLFIAEVVRAT